MGLRLVNTAPGDVTDPIKPGQFFHMGLKSETLSVQLATVGVDIGLSSFAHSGVLPEDSTILQKIGVTQAFETSERRRPITGSVTKSLSSGSIILTKNTNSLGEQGIYELTIPIRPGDSVLGYFKFRKKTAWIPYNPDWCNLTNIVGMYLGVEHGTFNSAAYAFLRDNGTGGSIVFAGPLQSYSTARPGQIELATDLDPVAGGNQGWMGLADNATIEIFIRFNTYVSPFRAELWTRIASTPAPIYQGSILLGALGSFPNSVFTNSRPGVSETATLFFGNIGRAGDVFQLDDWALFPDYRTNLKAGEPSADCERLVAPDLPVRYDSAQKQLPNEVTPGRWFPVTGVGALTPDPVLFYQPGTFIKPAWMSMSKNVSGIKTFKRTEPRLEEQLDGFMVEAFMSGVSATRIGDLIGPGFVVEDGSKSYQVVMLETSAQKMYGILSSGSVTAAASYYTPSEEVDFRSLKLVRLVVDRRRKYVYLYVDDNRVISAPMSTPAQVNSGVQSLPTISLNGNTLTMDVSDDGGTSWTPQTHTFTSEVTTINDIVVALNGDIAFTGAGPTQIEAVDRGDSFGIRTIQSGSLMGLRVNGASTGLGAGKLNLTAPSTTYGQSGTFPSSSDAIGKVVMGHPLSPAYDAELRLAFLNYMTRYLAWESEDSIPPDSTSIETGRRFTLNLNGVGSSDVNSSRLLLTKAEYTSSATKRFYKKDQPINNVGSVQIDFSFRVTGYTDHLGQLNAPNCPIDTGVVVNLGDKRVSLILFDCGASGRKMGIVPGSGSHLDIINTTPLGIQFSANVDWTHWNIYRLVVRAFKSIEVWSGTVAQAPLISIPWRNDTDGFDLPLDITTPGVSFGHFNNITTPSSSTVEWRYFRWGHSNGYEMALQQKYPNGMPKYLFGGKAFIYSNFDEA